MGQRKRRPTSVKRRSILNLESSAALMYPTACIGPVLSDSLVAWRVSYFTRYRGCVTILPGETEQVLFSPNKELVANQRRSCIDPFAGLVSRHHLEVG